MATQKTVLRCIMKLRQGSSWEGGASGLISNACHRHRWGSNGNMCQYLPSIYLHKFEQCFSHYNVCTATWGSSVKTQILKEWGWAWDSAFLTHSQVMMLILPAQRPHFEEQQSREPNTSFSRDLHGWAPDPRAWHRRTLDKYSLNWVGVFFSSPLLTFSPEPL